MAEPKKRPRLLDSSLSSKEFDNLNSFIYTGNTSFDLAVSDGKGMPVGAFITLFAARATGKTTICCDIAKRLIEQHKEKGIPYKVCYIDAENSLDLVKSMGLAEHLDSGDFIYNAGKTITYNQLEELYRDILDGSKDKKGKDIKLVIIDSITEITTEAMLEKTVEKGSYGPNQKACAEFLRKFQGKCMEKGVTTLVISHEVEDKDTAASWGGPKKLEAGGKAVGYSSSVLLKLTKKISEETKDGVYVKKVSQKTIHGEIKEAKYYRVALRSTEKNRYGRVGAEVEMLVEPGKKCVNGFIIHAILSSNGLLKTKKKGNQKFHTLDDSLLPPELKGVEMTTKELLEHFKKYEDDIIYDYIIPQGLLKYNIGEEIEDDEEDED